MKDLYLETENGRDRIDNQEVDKYHLKAGGLSPFTQKRIVGENEECPLSADSAGDDKDSESSIHEEFEVMPMQGVRGDGIDTMDNGFEFSQSEIIDFSQGVDSRMDENR